MTLFELEFLEKLGIWPVVLEKLSFDFNDITLPVPPKPDTRLATSDFDLPIPGFLLFCPSPVEMLPGLL
jgi:hypothetical protein